MTTGCTTCPERTLPSEPESQGSALRSALVAISGGGLLCVGVVGLFLPLPGVVLIAMGLSILGTRFASARRVKDSLDRGLRRVFPRKS